MINLTPIPKKIQERMRQKINAVGRDTTYFPDTDSNQLTQDKMSTRSTFLKMVSGQEKPVILMGGELISGTIDFKGNPIYSLGGNRIAGGYDDIYTNRNTSEAWCKISISNISRWIKSTQRGDDKLGLLEF